MKCAICKELTRVLESEQTRYKAARAAAYYLVCTELAARIQVDMERAKTALREHCSSCAVTESVSLAIAVMQFPQVSGNAA
jgi:hypothetical protein